MGLEDAAENRSEFWFDRPCAFWHKFGRVSELLWGGRGVRLDVVVHTGVCQLLQGFRGEVDFSHVGLLFLGGACHDFMFLVRVQ